MHLAHRRRTLRSAVLASTVAVLATFVVAPAAMAEDATAAPTSSAPQTTSAPAPTAAPEATPTETPVPTSAPVPTAEPTEVVPEPSPVTPTTAPSTAEEPTEVDAGDTVVGELVQAYPDPSADEHAHEEGDEHAHADEAPLSWIEPAEGDAVRVPTEDLPAVRTGSTIEVTVGDELADEASEEQGIAPAREVLAAEVLQAAAPDPTTAAAGAAPTNTVTAVLVVPAGGSADGTSITSLVNQVNGGVSSFWSDQSNDLIRLSAVAGRSGWVTSSKGCADPNALWSDVAAQIGWTSGAGKHLLLYVPAAPDCSYGLGTVGTSVGSGGVSYVREVATPVIAHELGHNFGLGHSSQVQCDGAVEVGTCQTRSYYDLYDVMGISWGQVGSLSAPQAALLGVLPASETVALTPSTGTRTVTLAPVSAGSGTRAVKLTDRSGTVYWLEYRQASGQDAWLGDSRNLYRVDSGVVLRRASALPNTSLLLDSSPSRENRWSGDLQTALPVGTAVSTRTGDFAVTVTNVTASGATLTVSAGSVPVAPPPQSVGLSLPRGNWETVTASGSTITVSGWAMDPDQPSTSSQVHVYVDGSGRALVADRSRPDIGAAYPGAGDAHGFSSAISVGPGVHTVCVYAIDLDSSSRNTPFGCRTVQTQMTLPVANWETHGAVGSDITISGWAVDPDQPTTSTQVHVYVDGVGRAVTANGTRQDIAVAFPGSGTAHGFTSTVRVQPGIHSVCVYAIDADLPTRNTALGCRVVVTQMAPPVGNWETVSTSGNTVRLTGWTLDTDQPSAPTQVHFYVDGVGTALTADRQRTDVARAFPGTGAARGFDFSTQVRPGAHWVCAYAIDLDTNWRNTSLGCRTVSTQVAAPTGQFESLTVSGPTVTASGWSLDPDLTSASNQVHIYVDGVGVVLTADRTRNDVAAAFPGAGAAHGFSYSTTLTPGTYTVCAYGIDLDTNWRNTALGCRTVTVAPR